MKTEWMIIFNGYVLLFLIRLDISLPFYYYNDSMENVIRIRSIFSLSDAPQLHIFKKEKHNKVFWQWY